MINRGLFKRVAAMESRLGMNKEPLPTLFVWVEDASIPDPGVTATPVVLSDETTIGATSSCGGVKEFHERLPGETVAKMEHRLKKLNPDCRVFLKEYAGFNSRNAAN